MFPRRMSFPLYSRLCNFPVFDGGKKKTRHLYHVCYARPVNASAQRQRDFVQERTESHETNLLSGAVVGAA